MANDIYKIDNTKKYNRQRAVIFTSIKNQNPSGNPPTTENSTTEFDLRLNTRMLDVIDGGSF